MADDSTTSPETATTTTTTTTTTTDVPNPLQPEYVNPNPQSNNPPPDPSPIHNPNSSMTAAPPSIQPYSSVPPPSFRPAFVPVPQFSPLPNPNFTTPNYHQNPAGGGGVPPPGVMMPPPPPPPAVSGGPQVTMSFIPPPMSPYAPQPRFLMPNGFPPPGIPRYPSPYPMMVRHAFPPHPPGPAGIIPPLSRPPVPGFRGPIVPPVVRPVVIPSITPTEKAQTTVYVGKISSTVENDFMLSLLQLCGPVKSWKRAQDPTNGTLKGFGFCEFDSAEGVLHALRLLSKLNIDGQELMLNVDQATREYLERYVEKKIENAKNLKSTEAEEGAEEEEESAADEVKNESPKPIAEDLKEDDTVIAKKEKQDITNFGLATDEDREVDREAMEKLMGMIEERLKTKPLPPPPPQTAAEASGNSNSELPARSRDGDSDVDIIKKDAPEDRNDDEMTSESKPLSEPDRHETSSPDRSKRNDRRSRDRERNLKWEKERELERYEREREQDRVKREREREYKIREDERRYKTRFKDWESREREKERNRKLEKEEEKQRQEERKLEVMNQERESDDGHSKKRKYKSSEERKRRLREKEDDLDDRLRQEEEIAEAKRRRAEEEQHQQKQEKDALKLLSSNATNGNDKAVLPDETNIESKDKTLDKTFDDDFCHGNHNGDGILTNGIDDESLVEGTSMSDTRQSDNAPARKLEFGLVGSGKRTAVPSVFHEEEDEDARKDKKMRPLVPIDYSTEEQEAIQPTVSGAPSSNLAAAAEFAKRISKVNPKEARPDAEKERSRRSHVKYSQRDRDRHDEETNRTRDDTKKETVDRHKDREQGLDKVKATDNQKLLDAKQLIDMIPKTKDELFSYDINWAIYDKNGLHERMRPWISKKITEFLGEEEMTLVDYIVSITQQHVSASVMLNRLQSILDDEADLFVLKMWRMLIFEIKKVETGLALKSKT